MRVLSRSISFSVVGRRCFLRRSRKASSETPECSTSGLWPTCREHARSLLILPQTGDLENRSHFATAAYFSFATEADRNFCIFAVFSLGNTDRSHTLLGPSHPLPEPARGVLRGPCRFRRSGQADHSVGNFHGRRNSPNARSTRRRKRREGQRVHTTTHIRGQLASASDSLSNAARSWPNQGLQIQQIRTGGPR
jgi:hypothetical protein